MKQVYTKPEAVVTSFELTEVIADTTPGAGFGWSVIGPDGPGWDPQNASEEPKVF